MRAICLEECLWIGEHLKWCKALETVNKPIDDNDLCTWKPANAEWIYLLKVLGNTLAYVPSTDTVHYVAPDFCLGSSCPATTVLVCQCVTDPDDQPKLLAVDILCYRSEAACMKPHERYQLLRHMAPHLPARCQVQWCGQRSALTPEFFGSLPHQVEAMVALGEEPGVVLLERR